MGRHTYPTLHLDGCVFGDSWCSNDNEDGTVAVRRKEEAFFALYLLYDVTERTTA